MYISLKDSREKGFRKWSDAHPAVSNENPGNPAIAAVLAKPPEVRRAPWLVPGVGNTL